MPSPGVKKLAAWAVRVVAGVAVAGALAYVLSTALELRRISQVMEQFLLDSAVQDEIVRSGQEEIERSGKTKISADELLHRTFMKRYGLDMRDYHDREGYFAPNGTHWSHWRIETKTAALLMWQAKAFQSAWQVCRAIHAIDDYYNRGDTRTLLIRVVEAVASKIPANSLFEPPSYWYGLLALVVASLQATRGIVFQRQHAKAQKRAQKDEDPTTFALGAQTGTQIWLLRAAADGWLYFVSTLAGFESLLLAYRILNRIPSLEGLSGGTAAVFVFLVLFGVLGIAGQLPHLLQQGKWPR